MASPTGSVRILSLFVTIKGHIKLFQVVTNVNIASVATVGNANGRAILKNVWNKLQPSILRILPNLSAARESTGALKIFRSLRIMQAELMPDMYQSNAVHASKRTAELY